jgi:hypothetical protein
MIDNFDKITNHLRFDLGIFHIQIIKRSKDNPNEQTKIITDFYVQNEHYLHFMKPGIISLCKEYNARAYINPNPKREESVLYHLMESALDKIKSKQYKILPLLAHAVDITNANGEKIWIVDIDEKDSDIEQIVSKINNQRSGYEVTVIDILDTPNGYHILTHPFDQRGLEMNLEIKKNNNTLLYAL